MSGTSAQCLAFAACIQPQVSPGDVISLASLLEEAATMAAGTSLSLSVVYLLLMKLGIYCSERLPALQSIVWAAECIGCKVRSLYGAANYSFPKLVVPICSPAKRMESNA